MDITVENRVLLNGQVVSVRRYRAKKKDGSEYVKTVSISLLSMRRKKTGLGVIRGNNNLNEVITVANDPRLVHELETDPPSVGDMMEIYGIFCAGETKKLRIETCPECGHENHLGSILTYVKILYFKITERAPEGQEKISWRQGFRNLLEQNEVSNRIKIFGKVSSEPNLFVSTMKNAVCSYYIQTIRNTVTKDGITIEETDYPFIRALGKIARDNAEHLKKGSFVYIDGSIQENEGEWHKATCSFCKTEFEYRDTNESMEIVPYSVEYLDNCVFEETEEDDSKYVADYSEENMTESDEAQDEEYSFLPEEEYGEE